MLFSKNKKISILLVGFIYLHYLKYFDYVGYDPTIGGRISLLLAFIMLLIFFIYKWDSNKCLSQFYVKAFIFVPMLSFIPCYLEHGQSIWESMRVYLPWMILFLYFFLHKANLSAESIIKLLTIYAVVRTGILIVEQFTYPTYWFAFRPETYDDFGNLKQLEVRSGIYRFYISDTYLSMFLVFYYFQKVLEKRKWTNILLFLFGLLGVYLDQTRQFMATTVLALITVVLISSKFKYKKIALLVLLSLGIALSFYFDEILGDLYQKTGDEISKDNIRFITYGEYYFNYWGGTLSVLFGNGIPGDSLYGKEMAYYTGVLGLWRSDVGIVGFLNQYGIVSVLFFLFFYWSFLRKNWNYIDMHLKMFFVATFFNLPLVIFFVNNQNWYVFWAFMMYLLDKSILRNKSIKCNFKIKN